MQSSKCFYVSEMKYRGHTATLKLQWSAWDSPWVAEQRTSIEGPNYGFILIQPLKEGVPLATILELFQVRITAMIDERCFAISS